jgi:transcription-repair coupling factor (superfamily II helicase)
MPLRSFLSHLEHDPTASRLADEGGSAFVSQSLRPFLLAALADRDVRRPAVVVAGDDRSARDLAADLRAWLRPRPVRFYPSRGVAYESHLTPPPHLVGLRVAALDALLDTPEGSEQPVVVVSAVALSEKVPDPKLRPHGFTLRVGELLDLDEAATDLVAAGYERVDQVEERGQFAVRGGLLDVYPATEERAVRVDLFDDEIESLRWFSTFTQRSLGDADAVEISPAAELAPEHRELAEIAALENPDERPDVAELLPVGDFRDLLDLVPDRAQVIVAADEDVEPALRDHWDDVCAAFHDTDAHHLYVKPDGILAALDRDASVRLSSISGSQELEIRAQAAEFASRSLREAEPELEKLVRSGYTTVVTWPQRGGAERAAYNLGARQGELRGGQGARLRRVDAARRLHRPAAQARGRPRAPADPPPQGGRPPDGHGARARPAAVVHRSAHGRHRRPRGPRHRALRRLRHQDGRGVTRDYLNLEYAGTDKVFLPVDQLAKISRYVGADGAHPPLSKLGGTRWDKLKARARRAAQELAGELLNLYAERKRRRGHAFEPDSDWLREFEEHFPYRETPDQRDAIESVKEDMESERPMDRLICGDVGYGKTEVALRAAFKAANAGKQT